MDIFDKLKSGESVDMMSEEYRPANTVVGGNPAKVIKELKA